MRTRFRDIPKMSPHEFTFSNMVRYEGATPCYLDIASNEIIVEKPWSVVGWSDQVDASLMHGREDCIALMLFHPEYGHFWEHYPFVDDAERDAAVFVSREMK